MSTNPYTIELQVGARYRAQVSPAVLRAAARMALRHQSAPYPSALTIVVTTDAALHKLNAAFLGHDYVTDVLSFPSETLDPESGVRYWGDIVLSWPRVRAQARAGGHSPRAEAQLLVAHGVLHLLGHDHATRRDQTRMWAAQAEILQALKSEISGPPTP